MSIFIRLVDYKSSDEKEQGFFDLKNRYEVRQQDFKRIPGSPIAYWVSERERDLYSNGELLETISFPRKGLDTGENEKFLRLWYEVSIEKTFFNNNTQTAKWFPYNKGGAFRRWYGNRKYLINWEDDGREIKARLSLTAKKPTIRNVDYFFREGFTWSTVSTGGFSARYCPIGALFDNGGCTLFANKNLGLLGGYLNSCVMGRFLEFLAPTLNFQPGDVGRALFPQKLLSLDSVTKDCIPISKSDWDSFETSWDFEITPLLQKVNKTTDIMRSYEGFRVHCQEMTDQMKQLEEENNRIFIEAYGLQDELTPDVPIEEITLFANPHYRYKGDLTDDEREARFKEDTMKELLSYAVGCMMGRYSLDMPGLVYAHAGNKEFDAKKYETFPADEDGIIPITEREWFDDDAACRFVRFIETAWDKKGLDANLDFIADAIGRKSGETTREVIRRYFADGFFKDHCQTYKNRPIYWLFSSGKEKAFQAIVYLHRYNEGTLSRMRTEYVLPLQTRISRQIEHLEKDRDAVSGSAANKIQREIIALRKQQAELLKFDELLRHYADKKIRLDLDDGVKVNYAKFDGLLADVKKISGVKEEEDAATD